MYIRWLGAFAKNGSLSESIAFELSRTTDVACEKLSKTTYSKSRVKARVGLVVDPKAVFKHWNSDVWSKYDAEGQLYKTRREHTHTHEYDHTECWAHPVYTTIVVQGDPKNLSKGARLELAKAISEHNMDMLSLVNGRLYPVDVMKSLWR